MKENGSPWPWRQRLIWTISLTDAGRCSSGADLVGDRHPRHVDVHDLELLDALVEILEEAVVFDRLQDLGQIGRDEGALALDLDQQVLAHQLAQRLADRDAADFQLAPQLVLGRESASPTHTARVAMRWRMTCSTWW